MFNFTYLIYTMFSYRLIYMYNLIRKRIWGFYSGPDQTCSIFFSLLCLATAYKSTSSCKCMNRGVKVNRQHTNRQILATVYMFLFTFVSDLVERFTVLQGSNYSVFGLHYSKRVCGKEFDMVSLIDNQVIVQSISSKHGIKCGCCLHHLYSAFRMCV